MKLRKLAILLVIIFQFSSSIIWVVAVNNTKVKQISQVKKIDNPKKPPIIFIPWIVWSWYAEDKQVWYDNKWNKNEGTTRGDYGSRNVYRDIKRWIPDPITHVYDPILYWFINNGYSLADVYYDSPNDIRIDNEDPNGKVYVLWYDWKRDWRISATVLNNLVWKIKVRLKEYNYYESNNINIVAHSMWWIVARSFLSDMCAKIFVDNKISGVVYKQWYNLNSLSNWIIAEPEYDTCSNSNWTIKNLVTIWTPNNGAPKAFFPWIYWRTMEVFWKQVWGWLWTQIWATTPTDFYEEFHGFRNNLKNWIIWLAQLIPSVSKDSWQNYLYNNKGNKIDPPKNKFLEILNSEENIKKISDKLWSNWLIYFSNQWSNNTWDYSDFEKSIDKIKLPIDKWAPIDIYSQFSPTVDDIYWEDWKFSTQWFWDWTVPTKYALLVSNTWKFFNWNTWSINSSWINTNIWNNNAQWFYNKFTTNSWTTIIMNNIKYREIKCDLKDWKLAIQIPYVQWWDKNELDPKEYEINWFYHDIQTSIWYKMNNFCQHTNLPTASSPYLLRDLWIIENISIKKFTKWLYLSNYFSLIIKKAQFLQNQDSLSNTVWINNNAKLQKSFDNGIKVNTLDNLWSSYAVAEYDILSPINLVIQDSQGRRIWVDPDTWRIINEIPWAWTSGNTEWSWEPEVFFIPTPKWEKHKILSYWTDNGEYHIRISNPSSDTWAVVIAWDAKKAFIDDYKVEFKDQIAFTNTTLETPATIDNVSGDKIVTFENKFLFKYAVNWNRTNVAGIRYKLNDLPEQKEEPIDWEINFENLVKWENKFEVYLVDKNWNKLTNKEADILVNISYRDEISYNNSNISVNPDISTLPTQKQNELIIKYIEQKNKTTINQQSQTYKWVNLKTGELQLKRDIKFSLPFSLYYSSNPVISSDLWLGWNHSYDSSFYYYELTWEFWVILPDGNANIFSLDNSLRYSPKYNNWLTASIDENNLDLLIVTNVSWDKYYFNKDTKKLIKINFKEYWEVNIYYNYKWISKVVWFWNALFFNYNDNAKFASIYDIYGNILNVSRNSDDLLEEYSYNKMKTDIGYNNAKILSYIDWISYNFNNNKIQNTQDENFYIIDYSSNIWKKKLDWKDEKFSEVKLDLDSIWNIKKITDWTWVISYEYSTWWMLWKINWEQIFNTYFDRSFKNYNTSLFGLVEGKYVKNNIPEIALIQWLDNNLYSFDSTNIYQILPNGKFKNLSVKDLNNIWSIFVTKKWDIYITDGWFIKKYSNWKLSILAWNIDKKQTTFVNNSSSGSVLLENTYHIAVDESKNIIYFTEKYNKWLKMLMTNNKTRQCLVSTDKEFNNTYINGLYFTGGELVVNSMDSDIDAIILDNQMIFSRIYDIWLDWLITRINNLSDNAKKKVIVQLDKYYERINNEQEWFNKDKMSYMINRLIEGVR